VRRLRIALLLLRWSVWLPMRGVRVSAWAVDWSLVRLLGRRTLPGVVIPHGACPPGHCSHCSASTQCLPKVHLRLTWPSLDDRALIQTESCEALRRSWRMRHAHQ
jgi:hypothetical protein